MNCPLTEAQSKLLEELVHNFLEQVCGGCKPFIIVVIPPPDSGGDTMEVISHGMEADVPDLVFARLLEIPSEHEGGGH